MRDEILEVIYDEQNRHPVLYENARFLTIVDYTGNHRQDHNGEEESRDEFLQNEKVKYFKKSLQKVSGIEY